MNKFPTRPGMQATPIDYRSAARTLTGKAGYVPTNTAYPGQNMGLSLDQVKELVENATKAVGTSFVSVAGTTSPKIQFPSNAKYILGIAVAGIAAGNVSDTMSMKVNNEDVLQDCSAFAFASKAGAPAIDPYYPLWRPVGGSTSIELDYTSAAGGDNLVFTIFYV